MKINAFADTSKTNPIYGKTNPIQNLKTRLLADVCFPTLSRQSEIRNLKFEIQKMQNEPNLLDIQMNVSPVKTKVNKNKLTFARQQNEPKTNPILVRHSL